MGFVFKHLTKNFNCFQAGCNTLNFIYLNVVQFTDISNWTDLLNAIQFLPYIRGPSINVLQKIIGERLLDLDTVASEYLAFLLRVQGRIAHLCNAWILSLKIGWSKMFVFMFNLLKSAK